jgi:hypothetical protein
MSRYQQRQRSACWICVALALATLATATPVAAIEVENLDFMALHFGRYAPGGDCARQPQVVVERTSLAFENGEARHKVERFDHAASFGGVDYRGTGVWLMPLYGRERPVLLNFNAGEQAGVLVIAPYDRGWPGGPALSARHRMLVDGSPYRKCG